MLRPKNLEIRNAKTVKTQKKNPECREMKPYAIEDISVTGILVVPRYMHVHI
jgi:hypothetical protein